MSFYSADALPRAITDLEGVLCAGGVMTLFGRGAAARLAIVLGAPPVLVEVPDDEVPDDEVPDDEVPDDEVPDDEAPEDGSAPGAALEPVPVLLGAREGADEVARAALPGARSRDQRALSGVRGPGGALQVPGDHASSADWDGVDEIPDDEFPVREDSGPDAEMSGPPDGVLEDDTTPEHRQAPDSGAPTDATDGPHRATLAVVTPDPVVEWRAHALCCAFRGRGVPADVDRLPDGRPVVRSAYRADLVPLAAAWRLSDGGVAVPPDLELDGPRLRLWVLAAGRRRGRAYTLGLDPHARATHEPLLTACQRAGLGATLAGDEDDPVVEIVGQRRQRRLAELVGDRPRTLVEGVWPE